MKRAVFVTGAANGTGFAIAGRFAKEGYDVYVTSRSAERAQEAAGRLAAEHGVFARGFRLDVGDEQQVKEVFSAIDRDGRLAETLVLNAADLGFGADPAKGLDFFGQSVEEFRRVFETNLVWNFMIVRQAALRMKQNGKGAVVFIASNTAYRAIPNRAAYCSSKGGMISLSKALAVDLGPYGIRSNVVLPGTIKTERWQRMGSSQIVSGSLTPIGDISDYEDIAEAAWYLGSDASRNVTGAELTVDGGMSCQLYPQELTALKKRFLEQQHDDFEQPKGD